MPIILDGKKISDEIKREIKDKTTFLKEKYKLIPGLAFIIVGNNPASELYVSMKNKACDEVGFFSITNSLPEDTSEFELLKLINQFNIDKRFHGILIQLPLPKQIDSYKIIEAIDHRKDVDGFHPINIGKLVIGKECLKPCTPSGIHELLKRYNIPTAGKHVVVLGRSNIVGKPVANIFLQKETGANSIVTIAHTAASDFSYYTKQADILIAAIGKPEIITGEMIKPGCVVVDVGINKIIDTNRKSGYRIVGDVHFESASKVASAITPVPGGVGPMTIAMLLSNTLQAAESLIHESF